MGLPLSLEEAASGPGRRAVIIATATARRSVICPVSAAAASGAAGFSVCNGAARR